MKKRLFAVVFTAILAVSLLTPVTVSAQTPAYLKYLRKYIRNNGAIIQTYEYGSDSYIAKISYQKKKKRFLFQCDYTNGRSTTTIKMYMPVKKLKKSYKVKFNETVRSGKRTAKISGKAKLKRKSYSNLSSYLKFTRKNKTSISKKITNKAYQNAANSSLRMAVSLWELGLENGPALSLRDLGFNNIAF